MKKNDIDAKIELREEDNRKVQMEMYNNSIDSSDIKNTEELVDKQVNYVEDNNTDIITNGEGKNNNRLINHEYSKGTNSCPYLPLSPGSCFSTVVKSTPDDDITQESISKQGYLGLRKEQYSSYDPVDTSNKITSLFPVSVASVASVAETHRRGVPLTKKSKAEEVGLPEIPCMFCDYKDCIEFDLELHYLERHRPDLIKLPLGKGSMDYRAECAVAIAKKRMFNGYKEIKEDMDFDFEESEDVEKEDND